MAKQGRSLLMAYIRRKYRSEAAAALLVFAMLAVLIGALASAPIASVGAATGLQRSAYSYQAYQSYQSDNLYSISWPTSGLAVSQSAAFIVMWLLALLILAPLEWSLRKK